MFFSRQFFFAQCRKNQQGKPSMLCFRKLLVAKFFMDKKGGISRVSVERFFSHSAKKTSRVTILCYVSENFWQQNFFMDKKGGISRVSVENFLSDSAEKIRSGTLQCVINFGYQKILCFRGLCNDFLSKKFCLTVPKHFVAEPFCAVFQRNCSSEKVYG